MLYNKGRKGLFKGLLRPKVDLMTTSVSGYGSEPSYNSNSSSDPADPELDPVAAAEALSKLYNDPTFKDIAGHMGKMQEDINNGPYGSAPRGNWDSATDKMTSWWCQYEPISGFCENCGPTLYWDENIVNAPTVTLWASFFGVQTGYSDPSTEGGCSPFHSPDGHHDPGYTVQQPNDSIGQMLQAMKGKIDTINTNLLGVSNNPALVAKYNALRVQMEKGLSAASQLNDWKNSVMAWARNSGVADQQPDGSYSYYNILKTPCATKDGYKMDYPGIQSLGWDNQPDDAWAYVAQYSGPNHDDPYPRPPFNPIQLAMDCLQTCQTLANPE